MTLMRTRSGLVIYSPVALAAAHIEQIHRLGSVAVIIAPNLFHHMFLRPYMAAFPAARVLVPNGLEANIGPVPGAEITIKDLDLDSNSEIAHHIFAGHRLHETALFHRPTATLITADLLYNFQPENFAAEKMFFRLIGSYGAPTVTFYHRFAVQDKAAVRVLMETVESWRARRIVMCHGRIIAADNAGEMFTSAWARLQ